MRSGSLRLIAGMTGIAAFCLVAWGFAARPDDVLRGDRFGQWQVQKVQQRGGRMSREEREKMVKERFEKMCQFLKLDDKQKQEAQKLLDQRQKDTMQLFSDARDGKIERDQARDKMETVMKKYHDDLVKILTTEQKDKLKTWEEQNPEPRRGGRGGPGDTGAFLEQFNRIGSQDVRLA